MSSENYWMKAHRRALTRRSLMGAAGSAAAGLGALALAGCGDDDEATTPAPTTSGSTAAAQTAGASPSAAAAARIDYSKIANEADFFKALQAMPPKDFDDKDIKTGGTLTRLYNREPPLDFVTSGLTGPISEAINGVYSRLIRLASSADLKNPYDPVLEQDLATKWERPDATTVILTLASNVKFQNLPPLNGRALKVDDIKYTFERGKTYAKSLYKQPFGLIKSVEDVGNGQVKLTLTGPHPAIEQQLSAFYMNIIPPEIGDKPEVSSNTAVGTGGMMMTGHTQNVSYEYKKNPDYFKKDAQGRQKPYIDGYKLAIVNDEATRQAILEKGDADFTYNAANPIGLDSAFAFFKRNPNWIVQFRISTKPSYAFIGRNDRAPWNDPRVRQALSLAIDRKSVIQNLYKGHAIAQPFFPWNLAVDQPPTLESLGPNYVLDTKKAKELLNAAGLQSLDLDVHYYEVRDMENALLIFQQSAAQAGIKLNLVKAPDAAAHSAKQATQQWNGLVLQGRSLDFIDPMASMPYFLPGSGLNVGLVNDQKLNDFYDKQRTTTDPAARKAVFKQIWDYMNEAVIEVTMPVASRISYWRPWVKGWRDTAWDADTGFGTGQMDSIWVGPKT